MITTERWLVANKLPSQGIMRQIVKISLIHETLPVPF